MEGAQIDEQMAHTQVTTAAFAAKFRSKRGKCATWISRTDEDPQLTISEIFTFITVDVKAYMPPMQTVTIYFLKDLITGKKRCKYYHPGL